MKFKRFFEKTLITVFLLPFCLLADQGEMCGGYANECEAYACCEEPCSRWAVYADFLWWRATEGGLALGKEILVSREGLNPITGDYALVTKDSRVRNLNFDYDPGFRLGVLYADAGCGWDSCLEWTHFHTKASATGLSVIDPSVPGYHAYWAFMTYWEVVPQNYPAFAKGKWTLDMDLLDFEIGHAFDMAPFTFRPHFGLRGALIDQNYHVFSNNQLNGAFDFNSTSYIYTSHLKADCDFWGVGPRIGFDVEFKVFCGISLFGKAAGTIAFGKFKRHAREDFVNGDDFYLKFNELVNSVHDNKCNYCSRAMTDLEVGLKWEDSLTLAQKQYPVSVAVSWEHHAFFDFNNFDVDANSFTNPNRFAFNFGPYANLLPSPKKQGDLFTQGLTVSAAIGF